MFSYSGRNGKILKNEWKRNLLCVHWSTGGSVPLFAEYIRWSEAVVFSARPNPVTSKKFFVWCVKPKKTVSLCFIYETIRNSESVSCKNKSDVPENHPPFLWQSRWTFDRKNRFGSLFHRNPAQNGAGKRTFQELWTEIRPFPKKKQTAVSKDGPPSAISE